MKRAEAIREFLKRRSGKMAAGDVALLAADLEVSRATAYRLIKLFRVGGTVISLVDRKRGRPDGHRILDHQREEIVRTTINRYYLTRNRPGVSQLVRDVQTNCISTGLKPPHRLTIKARLEDIDLQKRAKKPRRASAGRANGTSRTPAAWEQSEKPAPLSALQYYCPAQPLVGRDRCLRWARDPARMSSSTGERAHSNIDLYLVDCAGLRLRGRASSSTNNWRSAWTLEAL